MPALKTVQIIAQNVLLVEGDDEFYYIGEFCKYLSLTRYNGKGNLSPFVAAFRNHPEFHQVKSYAIIRDADIDAQASFNSIKAALHACSEPYPIGHATFINNSSRKVGAFIMPGNGENQGMLEDLCLKTVSTHPAMVCVDEFINCVKKQGGIFQNESKARVKAFFVCDA